MSGELGFLVMVVMGFQSEVEKSRAFWDFSES